MLLGELSCDPDDSNGLEPGSVGEKLAQMHVVRSCELVLDEYPGLVHRILAKNVRTEWPDVAFLCFDLQVKAEGRSQDLDVLLSCEPWGELT